MRSANTTPSLARVRAPLSLAAAIVCCAVSPAHALKLDLGNDDLTASFDTTVRYNAAMRTSERQADVALSGGAATDEGNFLFDKNDLVLSRFDLFSELDLDYKGRFGLRVSGSAWYDHNFPDRTVTGPGLASNYANGAFSPYVNRYYHGPSGEIADTFVWTNVDIGSTKLNIKAGRFAWLPGEFLLGNGGSLSFSMTPNDGTKSDLSPGASAKETALPIGQLGLTWQLNSDVSLFGQYAYEFRSSRISEGGTFFQVNDTALRGPQFISNPAVPRSDSFEGKRGDVALGVKWQPDWADGDAFGLWYRKFDDKNPTWASQVQVTPTGRLGRAVYAKDIELLGLTYNTLLGGWGIGAELNYRRNMPLAATGTFGTVPGVINDPGLEGPRGNTVHALVSGAVTLNKNPLFSSGSVAFQLDYSYLAKITDHKERYNGALSGVAGRCADNEILRGCSTRNALSIGANFTPVWQQALPSIDFSAPITLLYGLKGNAAAVGAGTLPQGSYLLRVGGRMEYFYGRYKHQFDLAYTTRDGKTGNVGGVSRFSGLANFRDRDYLSFTYSTNF